MSSTKLIYDRTKLASKGKPFYIVIYDDLKSGERNCKKLIYADSLQEADAKFHDMELNENYNIRRKTPYMKNKLIYKSKKAVKQCSFSKTGDLFIAIGEALESRNPKGELKKLADKYDLQVKDLKEAVETYIKYDLDSNGLDDNDVKHLMKQAGFSNNDNEG
jgi:hypothetical protein